MRANLNRYRYQVILNGVGLAELSDRIHVTDVKEAPKADIEASENAKYDGNYVTRQARSELEITIKLVIKEPDPARRAEIFDKIASWAQDGWLKTNYRPGKQLYVFSQGAPGLDPLREWAKEVTLAFTAYTVPYWQTVVPAAASISGGEATITPAGTRGMKTKLEARITNDGSGTMTGCKIACAGTDTFIELTGLSIASGGSVIIGYDDRNGLQEIKTDNGTSLMMKRTAASSDDVLLKQQESNTVTVTANTGVTAALTARGLYR